MKTLTLITLLSILSIQAVCQKGNKQSRYFDSPVLTDSVSTLFIPIRYNDDFLSANKISLWYNIYANIAVYNFKDDTYKNLFDTDTFIEGFSNRYYVSSMSMDEKLKT